MIAGGEAINVPEETARCGNVTLDVTVPLDSASVHMYRGGASLRMYSHQNLFKGTYAACIYLPGRLPILGARI